ncbi:hypothetical protein CBR_g60018 [Chara braunii]|uniref:Uncharacterized protein n=1 Tax=Chara braunii TaxID=69332 RepID=A0A388K8H9_CHABU|nr:hypothetical protein CBR_g60018 [Chara braunii]|eukprot:GBG66367.1 hypothetical protein CBR_g60018 [Chara braunii]
MAQHPKNFRTDDGKTGSGSRSGRDLEDIKNNDHATSSTRQMCSSWASKDLDCESRKLMPFADVMQKMMTSAYVNRVPMDSCENEEAEEEVDGRLHSDLFRKMGKDGPKIREEEDVDGRCEDAGAWKSRGAEHWTERRLTEKPTPLVVPPPHGEEPRRTTSIPVMATSRGGVGGVEQQGAQNLWCDYNKRVWCLDWACQNASILTTGRCGSVLFVAGRSDTTHLAGSVVEYADEDDDILKFTLRKLYRSDGSVDKLAKGCMVAGRKFGGYGAGAMALPFFVSFSPGHDEAVHMKDFLKVWAASVDPGSGMDVNPGTSIRRPVGFAREDSFGKGVGGEGGLSGTPPDPAVGMSNDSEDERARCRTFSSRIALGDRKANSLNRLSRRVLYVIAINKIN